MDTADCECRVVSRDGHSSVVMPDGSIVLMGGSATDGIDNDVVAVYG